MSIQPPQKIYEIPAIKKQENERTPASKKLKKKKQVAQKEPGRIDIRV